MSRVISTGDLHNVVTKRKMEYGKLATLVGNIVEEMVGETPTANAIPIPEGATNGDMIKAIFPNYDDNKARFEEDGEVYEVHYIHILDSMAINKFDESWWNAPYKKQVVE